MAKVKLKQSFRYSRNGIDIDEVPAGTIIDGECAKVALSTGAGATTKSQEAVGYNDDGFVVVETNPADVDLTDVDDAKEHLKILGNALDETSEALEAKKVELADIEKLVEAAKAELSELKPDADANTETEETQG